MRYIFTSLLFLLPAPASADVKSDLAAIETKMKMCIEKVETTIEQDACESDALNAADKVLTVVYRSAVENLKHTKPDDSAEANKEQLNRLIASERAWVVFKESDCKLQGVTMLGGTGEATVIGDCLYRMTRDRAKSIDDIFSEH